MTTESTDFLVDKDKAITVTYIQFNKQAYLDAYHTTFLRTIGYVGDFFNCLVHRFITRAKLVPQLLKYPQMFFIASMSGSKTTEYITYIIDDTGFINECPNTLYCDNT